MPCSQQSRRVVDVKAESLRSKVPVPATWPGMGIGRLTALSLIATSLGWASLAIGDQPASPLGDGAVVDVNLPPESWLVFTHDEKQLKLKSLSEVVPADLPDVDGGGQLSEPSVVELDTAREATAPEPTSASDVNGSDESDSSATMDSAAESPEARRLIERLNSLRRSPGSIRIASEADEAAEVPVSIASNVLGQEAPRLVAGQFNPIPIASRVHVPFCHQPLYYEERNLEREGQLDCPRFGSLQNARSSVRFLFNTAVLPYRLVTQPYSKCVTSSAINGN